MVKCCQKVGGRGWMGGSRTPLHVHLPKLNVLNCLFYSDKWVCGLNNNNNNNKVERGSSLSQFWSQSLEVNLAKNQGGRIQESFEFGWQQLQFCSIFHFPFLSFFIFHFPLKQHWKWSKVLLIRDDDPLLYFISITNKMANYCYNDKIFIMSHFQWGSLKSSCGILSLLFFLVYHWLMTFYLNASCCCGVNFPILLLLRRENRRKIFANFSILHRTDTDDDDILPFQWFSTLLNN